MLSNFDKTDREYSPVPTDDWLDSGVTDQGHGQAIFQDIEHGGVNQPFGVPSFSLPSLASDSRLCGPLTGEALGGVKILLVMVDCRGQDLSTPYLMNYLINLDETYNH